MREYNGFGYIGWGANTKHWRTSRGPFLIQQYKDMMFTSIKKSLASILFSPWLGHTGRSTDQSRTGSELACAVLCRLSEIASGPFDKTEPRVAVTKTNRSDGNPSTSSPRSMLEDIHQPKFELDLRYGKIRHAKLPLIEDTTRFSRQSTHNPL